MQRWIWIGFGVLLVAAVLVVVVPSPAPRTTAAAIPESPSAQPDGGADSGAEGDAGKADARPDSGPASMAFNTFPDGGSVPKLPASAPSQVRFGVILFAYQGAQYARDDAPTKAAALQKARKVLPAAMQDFREAVKRGDPGSAADAGQMPRGVLEPAVEYVLFTMAPDTVHEEPVDTPRGFWILRRSK